MFSLGWQELTLIIIIILIIYGPQRLPQIGNAVGKSVRNMRNALNGMEVEAVDDVSDVAKRESEKKNGLDEKW